MVPLDPTDRKTLLDAARQAIAAELGVGPPPEPASVSPALRRLRAAFVTVRVDGELRGCRGEAEPSQPLLESVIAGAVAAAVDDRRFEPIGRDELGRAVIQISALTPPRPIDRDSIVLGRHGLLVSYRQRSGLLLPQVPQLYGLDTVDDFLEALRRKAKLPEGIYEQPGVRLLGFEAESWGEPWPEAEATP